jgi:3-hydroxyacyl-CoA dehydrogenase
MGSRIAAHFANAGIASDLLDISTEAAKKGIENAARVRPGGFFLDSLSSLITPGSFDEHLDRVGRADWIIEAVVEKLDVKKSVWKKVEELRSSDSIVSTNTSGIPLRLISEGFSPEFQKHFLGTHFFNPPRYLHLLELIPGTHTDPKLLEFVANFAEQRLGKGIVQCKDTPNFIANRIGCFFCGTVFHYAQEMGLTVEEVDALTGPAIGLPNSATFRLLDIIGLDVMALVGGNLYEGTPQDPWRDRFLPPPFLKQMMERGWLGEKSGQGFYKRVGKEKEIHALDLQTFEYHPAAKAKFALPVFEDLGERLRALVKSKDRAGEFLWNVFADYVLYSAERVPEISDRIVEVDRAMRWGYAHKLGPFELCDALGFEAVCDQMEASGRALPTHVEHLRSTGVKSLYRNFAHGVEYVDFRTREFRPLESPGIVLKQQTILEFNAGASLVDLGDGVLCVEFHSKMNALGEDHMRMIQEGLERDSVALVIANQGDVFSAGANLTLVLLAAQEGEWEDLSLAVQRFQAMNMALKYARKPVVVAPFSRALGGACEMALHAHRVQASAETYMGLVEVGVGLIPAGGGTKEMLARLGDSRKCLELIGQAKVSSSALEARELGFLTDSDGVSMNPDLLIDDAKRVALALACGYVAPVPEMVKVGGLGAFAALKLGIWSYWQGGYISDYDVAVLEKVAHVLAGGGLSGEQTVSEQYLLDLEREAFLSLCGNRKTLERMGHMLKTGKALRN